MRSLHALFGRSGPSEQAPTEVPRASRESYYPLLDLGRFMAALAVIWLHVGGDASLSWSKPWARFAVPYFACSSVFWAFDAVRRHPRTSIRDYFLARFSRIYLVFLVWSVFYYLVRLFSAHYVEGGKNIHTTWQEFWWDGVAIQLWFLPFIFVANVSAFLAARACHRFSGVYLLQLVAWPALALLTWLTLDAGFTRRLDYASGLGYATLPACFLALFLGAIGSRHPNFGSRDEPRGHDSNPGLIGAGLMLFLPWPVAIVGWHRGLGLENMAGFGLFLAGLGWRIPRPQPALVFLGSLAFGIYLIHPFFVEGLQHLLPHFGIPFGSARSQVAVYALGLVASLVTVPLMRRSRAGRFLT